MSKNAHNPNRKAVQNVALLALSELLRRKAGRGVKGRFFRFVLRRVEKRLRKRGLGGAYKRTWF